MKEHPNIEGVQANACRSLLALRIKPNVNLSSQSIEQVVRCMDRFPNVAGVQENASGVPQMMASRSDSKMDTRAARSSSLAAMNAHPDVVGIQERGYGLLLAVASKQGANKQSIRDMGALDAVLAGMELHSNAAAVQELACGVLHCLLSTL